MKKILVVDDHREVRELVEVTLRSEHHQIFQAESAEEAIRMVAAQKMDLVIMDLMMPGSEIDGLEATKRIKSSELGHECAVIILTAKGQKMDTESGFAAGADGYLVKPFSPLELLTLVEKRLA